MGQSGLDDVEVSAAHDPLANQQLELIEVANALGDMVCEELRAGAKAKSPSGKAKATSSAKPAAKPAVRPAAKAAKARGGKAAAR